METSKRGVISLPEERVGPYLRALVAGLNVLAPHEDFVPLSSAIAHLNALDPRISGPILFPAEVDALSGLPAFPWMERALSEQDLARTGTGYTRASDHDLSRVDDLDSDLGNRMRARKELHIHLRNHVLLPISRVTVSVKRRGRTTDFGLTFDRMSPDGAWLRIRADISGPAGWERLGPISINSDGKAIPDKGLRHLLSRHQSIPLIALRNQLCEATGVDVIRLSRSTVGPFWFPGMPLPEGVPTALGKGLLLHLSTAIISTDIQYSAHRDPLVPMPAGEIAPEGYGLYRERRFAASQPLVETVRNWSRQQGVDVLVTPMVPSR